MKRHALLLAITIIALATFVASSSQPLKRQSDRRYYTLYIPQSNNIYSQQDVAETVARTLNVRMEGPVGELKSYYWVSAAEPVKRSEHENDSVLEAFKAHKEQRLNKRDEEQQQWDLVQRIDPQIPRRRYRRGVLPELHSREPPFVEINQGQKRLQEAQKNLGIQDPGFARQWHLINHDNVGNDINVTGVWSQGITGNGSIVAILDDGLDYESRDLADNFYAAGSYDFNDHIDLPKPKLFDDTHGTRCAGQIAAVKNNICGIGIAYDARVAGVRILSGEITDADEAAALNYKFQENDIFSCSWGPPDNGETMEAPEGILADAFVNGIENGRGGKGSIYVFATGNGAVSGDNCNFDGYTNSIYTITVGAIDHNNAHPPYSESCSAQMVVTYSSGGGQYIYTTNVGEEDCSDRHGGTSAAAPSAAGVFALVLSVRPELTWRDLQHLCVQTAVPISTDDDDWKKLPSGRLYNHKFGYGKLDAYAIVEAAKTFKLVNKQTHIELPVATSKQPIPDSSGGKKVALQTSIQVTEKMVKDAGLMRLEHVTATVNIEHQRRGDIVITLQSPNKVESELATLRPSDSSPDGIRNWKFMSVKHWEENPVGEWTLLVYDMSHPEAKGSLVNWTLTLWGEQDPAFKGEPVHSPLASHPTPTTTQKAHHTSSTLSSITTSSTSSTSGTSEHIPPRPTRVKPSQSSSPSTSEAESASASPSESKEEDNVEPAGQATSEEESGNANTAVYGFVGSAAILTLATGLYLYRRNNWRPPSLPTDDEGRSNPDRTGGYEFTILRHSEEDEADHDTGRPSDDRPLLNENGQPRS